MSETVCTDGRRPDKIWERVPDCGAISSEVPATVGVDAVALMMQRYLTGKNPCHLSPKVLFCNKWRKITVREPTNPDSTVGEPTNPDSPEERPVNRRC